jgi:hypothetical protein
MLPPLEPLEPDRAHGPDRPSLADPPLDDGTMEHPLPADGTLGSRPRLTQARIGRWPRWAVALPILLFVGVASLTLRHPVDDVQPPQTELVELGTWLTENPEGPDDLATRGRYADALTSDGQYAAAFEEYLTVVRRSPTSREGWSALVSAVIVAEVLAASDGAVELWTERWVAAVDRFARYWPGDPMTPVLLEETTTILVARGFVEEAELLTAEHVHR